MTTLPQRIAFTTALREQYDAEQHLACLLSDIMNDVPDTQVGTLCHDYLQVTMSHIRNLERCFALTDATPIRTPALAMAALAHVHTIFVRAHPVARLIVDLDLDLLAAMTSLDIAAYQRLIALGTQETLHICVPMLQDNLEQTVDLSQQITHLQQVIHHAEPTAYPCAYGI